MEYIRPVFAIISVISMIDFLTDNRKISLRLSIIFAILAAILMIYTGLQFMQLYLFLFLLSISSVILALKKEIDAFTIIGIVLMLVMLVVLLKYPLID